MFHQVFPRLLVLLSYISVNVSSWDHPNDHFFKTLYKKTKEQENASIKLAKAAAILFSETLPGESGELE